MQGEVLEDGQDMFNLDMLNTGYLKPGLSREAGYFSALLRLYFAFRP